MRFRLPVDRLLEVGLARHLRVDNTALHLPRLAALVDLLRLRTSVLLRAGNTALRLSLKGANTALRKAGNTALRLSLKEANTALRKAA